MPRGVLLILNCRTGSLLAVSVDVGVMYFFSPPTDSLKDSFALECDCGRMIEALHGLLLFLNCNCCGICSLWYTESSVCGESLECGKVCE